MICLPDNWRMHQLARKFGAELSFNSGSVVGQFAVPEATAPMMRPEIVVYARGNPRAHHRAVSS